MTLQEALARLEALGSEKMRAQNVRHGVTGDQYGVKLGDLRKVAKEIGADHALALALWATGVLEARLLAILLIKPKALSGGELDAMVRSNRQSQVAEWLASYVVKPHPEKERLRRQWLASADPAAARAGWGLTAARVEKDPDGLDLDALLDRIEGEMPGADPLAQWTMNWTLGTIGIHHPAHRARALAIGETIGLYRDWPRSPGCIPPFVPVWVEAMVRRQGA
ncbi:MAG TPA: DNA alkylation repair protein [Allosphingosinicella sp.]|nr:DNA alkylation repair protein [Allosphingosinicella sp.]